MHFGQACAVANVKEPMFAYVSQKDQDGYSPIHLYPDRELWRHAPTLFGFVAEPQTHQKLPSHRPKAFELAARLISQGLLPTEQKFKCILFGLAYDQANPLMWRQETMPVPRLLLVDADAVGKFIDALQFTEVFKDILYRAARKVAEKYMAVENFKADAKNITRFVTRLDIIPSYWSSLEIPFRRFLKTLHDAPDNLPPTDLDQLAIDWKHNVMTLGKNTFLTAMTQWLRSTPRELDARMAGEKWLAQMCDSLFPTTQCPPATTPSPATN
ncbi:MAG: type I-E CRISPR-associated protein Cse1/CasA [Chloracidobacterium sp.]